MCATFTERTQEICQETSGQVNLKVPSRNGQIIHRKPTLGYEKFRLEKWVKNHLPETITDVHLA